MRICDVKLESINLLNPRDYGLNDLEQVLINLIHKIVYNLSLIFFYQTIINNYVIIKNIITSII